jgi:hypothetical protein
MADWLELQALLAADGRASFSDLRRYIAGIADAEELGAAPGGGGSADELLADDTFQELGDRQRSCGPAYPFALAGDTIATGSEHDTYWPYIFCLLVCLKASNRNDPGPQPTRIFEEVAEVAAGQYIGGRSLKFGFPRRVMPASFMEATEQVTKEIGEGVGARKRPSTRKTKDARLDVIAWRPFPDNRPGKLILFGQCAAGGNWPLKLTDLQPREFTEIYWKETPAVHPIKAFFTPFRLGEDSWYVNAKLGGILFDRCRIAHFAYGEPAPPSLLEWNSRFLGRLRG